MLNEPVYINRMMKLLHIPAEIIKNIESGGGFERNPETDSFIISIPHKLACDIDFYSNEDVFITQPVPKIPKFSTNQSSSGSNPSRSSNLNNAASTRCSGNPNIPSAIWSTRNNLNLSEREYFLAKMMKLFSKNSFQQKLTNHF